MNSDDDAGPSRAGLDNDDVNLPKATIYKVIQEFLPADYTCAKEAKDLMAECCKEFVLTVASEANEICDKESKKTMAPEHIIAALKALGFETFVDQVQDVFSEHKELAKGERQMKKQKQSGSGMTQEELLKAQEELFAASRAKFEAGADGNAAPAT